MQNGDEASPSNILAGIALLVKILITLDRMVYFVQILYIYVFNIGQQLVYKMVTRLHRASFWPVGHDAAHFTTGLELKIMILWFDTKMST